MALSSNTRALLTLGGGVGVLGLSCCACLGAASWKTHRDDERFGALAAACEGRGVPAAASSGPTRVAVLMQSPEGWRVSMGMTPDDTEPPSLAETTHVLCVAQERATVGECGVVTTMGTRAIAGTESTMSRTQARAQVRLVRARDATEVQRDVIEGPMPDTCEQHPQPIGVDFQARDIRLEDIEAWLSRALRARS